MFSPLRFRTNYDSCGVPVAYYTWDEIILYRVFYPLLEEIDETHLVICDEIMRKRNRNELTYNCLHHYQNQTPHRISFEYFPIVEDKEDFMILIDFDKPGKWKRHPFDSSFLADIDILCAQQKFKLNTISSAIPDGAIHEYERKRDTLFENLGSRDPDTIPRELHLWCGKYKEKLVRADTMYVARNKRFKRGNIIPYKEIDSPGDYTIIDFPHARIDFNDFLRVCRATTLQYLSTGLKVDCFYEDSFRRWVERLEDFYAKASIY